MATMLFTALRKYAEYAGRARRKEYWQFVLLTVLVGIVAGVLDAVLGLKLGTGRTAQGPIATIANLALLLPSLAVTVRRLHDTGRTGWWMVAPLVLGLAFTFAFLIPSLTGGTARVLREAGLGIGLGLAFIIVSILLFVFMLQDSSPGANRFGPDPKAAERGV